MILAFQRWIICAYEQVPRDIDVFCVRTQIFLTMILSFQRWIICASEQVPRGMDVFCVRTQIFLKMLFDLPTLDHLHVSFKIWRIYQRTKSNNGAQTSTYLYTELYKSLFGISAHICKKSTSLLRICVFAQIIQSLTTLLSKITIRNFCACTQKFPRLF